MSLWNVGKRAWEYLPETVVSSAAANKTKLLVKTARIEAIRASGGVPPEKQRVIRTLKELDAILAALDDAARESDDALRRGFLSFRMEDPRPSIMDPFSSGYRQWVMDLYEWIHGDSYAVDNERTEFDVDRLSVTPFPYSTGSTKTVGDHLIGVGNLIRSLSLHPHANVLEFGPGWGNLTLALAQMGHQVTAIEIEQRFVDLITRRARATGVDVEVRHGDFFSLNALDQRFEAVIFFESFHHCADHLVLLERLHSVVAENGAVVFAAEPISKERSTPWGLRMDGEALWAIRRNGWMELGFRRSYFYEALERTGWSVQRTNCRATPWGEVFVARAT